MTRKKGAAFQSSTFSLFSQKQKSSQSQGHDDGKKRHSRVSQKLKHDRLQRQSSAKERLDWLDYFYQWKYAGDGGSAQSSWHLVSLKRGSDHSQGDVNTKKRRASVNSEEEDVGVNNSDLEHSPASNVSFESDWSKDDAVNFKDGPSSFWDSDRTSMIPMSVF